MPNALLSVYNKEGVADFARELVNLGWKIYASGGTAIRLEAAEVPAIDLAKIAGGGAILQHRVVTLSRHIHAGILARNSKEDLEELKKEKIPWFDLVCVDMYPLKEEIGRAGSTHESVIEKNDIGGPALIRAAVKGGRIVLSDKNDWQGFLDWLYAGQPDKERYLSNLAMKAEAAIADYALAFSRYLGEGEFEGIIGRRYWECKYGENPWQSPAAFYRSGYGDPLAFDCFKLEQGTSPSYNNLCDLDRLIQTVTHIAAAFDINIGHVPRIAVGVKHGNASGAAVGEDIKTVLENMVKGDPRALFGGVVMVNFQIDEPLAELLMTYGMPENRRRILDGIIAPSFRPEAMKILRRKNDKCRLISNIALENIDKTSLDATYRIRSVRGGFLSQPNYARALDLSHPELFKMGESNGNIEENILLAWAVGSTSSSNTITLVKDGYLIGNGTGQQDRVSCCRLAVERAREAGHDTEKSIAYSDSYFPFLDGPEILAKAGVKTIFSSSGSVRDHEFIEFCQNRNISLYQLSDKEIRGFYGH